MATPDAPLEEALQAAGQEHVLEALRSLPSDRAQALRAQLEELDLAAVQRLRAVLVAGSEAAPPAFAPPELFPLERDAAQERRASEAIARGEELLASGKVGFLLVAGGQGSRLGFEGPKGLYPVGPVTGAPLFAWHAARIHAARERAGTELHWFVMTSRTNDEATRAWFAEQDHLGLGADTVHFFVQSMLPALDADGRMIFSAPGELFLAPNGHGGTLEALARSGMLERAGEAGIEHFSYFQVDNPLVRPADPLFLGLHALEGAEMSSKVVAKRDADEKVGVLGLADGRLGCIEYSDLPADLRTRTDADGQLTYRAGNIAVHAIRRDFIERLTAGGELELPWHLARKRMKAVDPVSGAPCEVDGVKFETFVFDALAATTSSVVLEVDRALEFSPVKNAEGSDSPATCRQAMTGMFAAWMTAAGHRLPDAGGDGTLPIEVDPRVAEDAAQFKATACSPRQEASGVLYR
jgi:UDP-N-acetylglucosamine/UDP-N-acetylgalactosamine diphosphorylase